MEVKVRIDKTLRNNLDAEGRVALKNIKNNLKDLRQHIPIQYREIEFTISCDLDKRKIYLEFNNFTKFKDSTSDNIKDNVIKMLENLNLENIEENESKAEAKIMFNLGEKGQLGT